MKPKILLFVSTVAFAAFGVTVASHALPPLAGSTPAATGDDTAIQKADNHSRMEQKEEVIRQRVRMSAPMELPEEGEEDFVALAEKEGWIIEATLEEVETALSAAKATSSKEDDAAAARLAHWGSYRFYLDEKPSGADEKTGR